jgi:hypothetical protein
MQLPHALHRTLAASVFALTVFFAPHLFAAADEMIALWRYAPAIDGPFAAADDEPTSEFDVATQAALDDALRHSAAGLDADLR